MYVFTTKKHFPYTFLEKCVFFTQAECYVYVVGSNNLSHSNQTGIQ